MLINFFKSSYPTQYLLLLLVSGILWLPSFLYPPEIVTGEITAAPAYDLIIRLLSAYPLLLIITGYLLLITGGFLLNVVMISHDLVSKNSLLPALVYVIFMSIHTESLTLTQSLLSAIFIILALNELFKLYELTDALKSVLTIGLLLSSASLFNFSCILLFPFIFASLLIVRIGTWRDWVVPIIGFLIPYLYLWTYYFITDQLPFVYSPYIDYFNHLFNFQLDFRDWGLAIEGAILVIFVIPALFKTISLLNKYNIVTRRRLSISFWLFIFCIIAALLPGDLVLNNLYFIPGVIFVAHRLDSVSHSIWREILFLLIIIAIGINHYLI
jgi:hypothetical protein